MQLKKLLFLAQSLRRDMVHRTWKIWEWDCGVLLETERERKDREQGLAMKPQDYSQWLMAFGECPQTPRTSLLATDQCPMAQRRWRTIHIQISMLNYNFYPQQTWWLVKGSWEIPAAAGGQPGWKWVGRFIINATTEFRCHELCRAQYFLLNFQNNPSASAFIKD